MVTLAELAGIRREPRPCDRKIRHATLSAAVQALVELTARPDCIDPDTLNAYECRHCGGAHVGHLAELRAWRQQN